MARIDEKRQHQGEGRIDRSEFNRLALALDRPLEPARLDNRGVKIEIVGHNGCAQDSDANIEHLMVLQDFQTGDKAHDNTGETRFSEEQFRRKAGANGGDKRED